MTDQPLPNVDPEMHEQRIQALERQLQEHLDGWKRAKADYLNLKKEAEREKQEIAQFAVAQSVIRFLPIYDNLNRALKHVPAEMREQEWVKGVEHTKRLFLDTLGTVGVEIIPTVGKPFDPNLHHAVSHVKQDGAVAGTIIEEVKAGFQSGGRVIEPAHVTVAQ